MKVCLYRRPEGALMSKHQPRIAFVLAAAAACLLLPTAASAQDVPGFALNRYDPSERGSDWFANESLDLRGDLRPSLGLVLDWSYRPLVLYEEEGGDIERTIVRHQVYGHVGGGLILADRFRFAANIPILLHSVGNAAETPAGTLGSSEGASFGDIRLGIDARLFGTYGDAAQLAFGIHGYIPSGSQEAFAGDGKVRFEPRVMLAGDIGMFTYAARMGVMYRANDDEFAGTPMGTETTFGAAAGLRLLDKSLVIGPEIYGSTGIADGDAFFARRTTPFELIFGGKLHVSESVRLGAGVGPGLTRGVGSPAVRVLAGIEWMPAIEEPPPPPSDRDHDGIIDLEDACPDVSGLPNPDPKKHGCPPPSDRDGDTIIDEEDACPDQPGPANPDPTKHGCPPPPDTDGDTIIDPEDACPTVPGVRDPDPKKNGCPAPVDTDGDGIFDPEDACPKDPGEPNADPKKHGCPKAIVDTVSRQIKILERIEFDTNKATIRAESDGVLTAVLKVLNDHPEITGLRIEGHTDNRGQKQYNKNLSNNRAKSVMKWLVKNGIDAKRLTAAGFGMERPIDTNDTDDGRQTNRRVEFHIVNEAQAAAAGVSTAPTPKPGEAKPAEAKPAEAKPAEAKPAEAKPAEAKPAEAKPAEAKPAAVPSKSVEPAKK